MSTHLKPIHLAFSAAIALLMASPMASAASVAAVSGDAQVMGTLGTPYIHSRHTGTMPYWGPCYRCARKQVCSPKPYPHASSCAGPINGWAGSDAAYTPDAQWIYGTNNCRNAPVSTEYVQTFYNNNTGSNITGTAWYAMNDSGAVYVNGADVANYSDNNHTGHGAYPGTGGYASSQITLPPGKDTILMRVTNAGGSSYGILQVDADINGTEEAIITTNPNTWEFVVGQCPVQYQRVCTHYSPTNEECSVAPNSTTLDPSPYAWSCSFTGNPELGTVYSQSVCQNGSISQAGAQWIFGANDGATGTAQSGYTVMQAKFDNTLGSIDANLTFYADNIGWVWINGQQVAYGNWESSSNTAQPWSGTVTVPSGKGTIDFMVMNYPDSPATDPNLHPNPSMGILSLTDPATGQVLAQSNAADWGVITNYPATPDPTPSSLLSGTGYTAQNCAAGGC